MKAVVSNILTSYFDDGPADAGVVLMLHGWGADAGNFSELSASMGEKFRVIRLDLPGFGGTERPPAGWHIHDYAVFVQQFLRKLGIADVSAVLGHSFGGRIAMKGLAEGLIPAQRLILIDSAGLKPAGSPRRHVYAALAKTGKAALRLPGLSRFAPALRRRLYASAGSIDYLTSGDMKQIFLNAIADDQSAEAAGIKVPTLLIWGAKDTDTPPADGRRFAQLLSHSSLHIISGAGHFAHTDAPDEVSKLIREFLS